MQNYDSPTEQRFTTWHNPLKVVQKCRIYKSPGNWEAFVVPPGEQRQLPSEFDSAIQVYNDDGVITSGQCPLLVRVDGPPMRSAKGNIIEAEAPRLHEALDPMGAEKKSAIERLAEAQLARLASEHVEQMATVKAAAAAEQSAAADKARANVPSKK